jgi:hypothetical protein
MCSGQFWRKLPLKIFRKLSGSLPRSSHSFFKRGRAGVGEEVYFCGENVGRLHRYKTYPTVAEVREVGCLSGLPERVLVDIHAGDGHEFAVVEFAFHNMWVDFRIDAISADDKIGFGGLAVGEGELDACIIPSRIGQLHTKMDLNAFSFGFLK